MISVKLELWRGWDALASLLRTPHAGTEPFEVRVTAEEILADLAYGRDDPSPDRTPVVQVEGAS